MFKRLTISALIIFTSLLMAQDIVVPIHTQYPLLLKILTFDKNLPKRCKDEIIIAIVYQEKARISRSVMQDLVQEMEVTTIQRIKNKPIRSVLIDLDSEDLDKQLADLQPHILYVAPLRAYDLEQITDASRKIGLLTMSGVPEYIDRGLAIGLDMQGLKPQILINRAASLEEGANFQSQILKLAKIID